MDKFLKFSILLITCYLLLVACDSFAEEIDPNSVINQRQQLQEQLNQLESQIDGLRNTISGYQKQSTTLERDIAILDAQIKKIKLEIKARNIQISQLSDDIGQKAVTINVLSDKIDKERESLAALLRRTREIDSNSLIEVVLGYEKLSDFFVESDSFETIQANVQDSLIEIRGTKQETEQEKTDLEDKRTEQTQLKAIQEVERKKLTNAEGEKKKILKVTKGEEAKYQKYLTDTQKSAANIRSQLFLLTGSPAIPFEKAVEYAVFAWRATGVRPAFLLGVIAEESNLGANIGKGNWKVDMANCSKQRDAFVQITSELGLDPDLMPVSKKAWYGSCGGAMGPAQFMPTTWWNPADNTGYKNLVAKITGHNPPSPWDPKDAFVAAALLLKDNGAASSERNAALKYLAGSYWKKSAYAFYGDDVMDLAAKYQNMIDIIKGS